MPLPALPLGAFILRVVLPFTGVVAAVALLFTAAIMMFFDLGTDGQRQAFFISGVIAWFAGIGWGVWINGSLAPQSSNQG